VFARIARFEGAEPDRMQDMVDEIRNDPGPPEGVPATRFMMFLDRASGTGLAVSFYESEEDMRAGDQALNDMSPPPIPGLGRRVSVELYEVPLDLRQ
jgi:hypothetical protein